MCSVLRSYIFTETSRWSVGTSGFSIFQSRALFIMPLLVYILSIHDLLPPTGCSKVKLWSGWGFASLHPSIVSVSSLSACKASSVLVGSGCSGRWSFASSTMLKSPRIMSGLKDGFSFMLFVMWFQNEALSGGVFGAYTVSRFVWVFSGQFIT